MKRGAQKTIKKQRLHVRQVSARSQEGFGNHTVPRLAGVCPFPGIRRRGESECDREPSRVTGWLSSPLPPLPFRPSFAPNKRSLSFPMGCSSSVTERYNQKIMPHSAVQARHDSRIARFVDQVEPILACLHMTKDQARVVFSAFDTCDRDQSGAVDLDEFVSTIKGVKRTKFTRRCFSIVDEDGKGEFSFAQFLVCVWAIGTLEEENLAEFAFQLYDDDNSGLLEFAEVESIVDEVYDLHNRDKKGQEMGEIRNSVDVRVKKARQGIKKSMDENGGTAMSAQGFVSYVKHHSMVLFPAFVMRSNLRSHIVEALQGFQRLSRNSFWPDLSKARRGLKTVNSVAVEQEKTFHILEALHKDASTRSLLTTNLPPPPTVAEKLNMNKNKNKNKHSTTPGMTPAPPREEEEGGDDGEANVVSPGRSTGRTGGGGRNGNDGKRSGATKIQALIRGHSGRKGAKAEAKDRRRTSSADDGGGTGRRSSSTGGSPSRPSPKGPKHRKGTKGAETADSENEEGRKSWSRTSTAPVDGAAEKGETEKERRHSARPASNGAAAKIQALSRGYSWRKAQEARSKKHHPRGHSHKVRRASDHSHDQIDTRNDEKKTTDSMLTQGHATVQHHNKHDHKHKKYDAGDGHHHNHKHKHHHHGETPGTDPVKEKHPKPHKKHAAVSVEQLRASGSLSAGC